MQKKKVLVVDNDSGVTEFLKSVLEMAGPYKVKTENRASHGLETALSFRPEIILLDIMMPDMDGTELARRIRSNESLKDVPIIFLTGVVTPDEVGPSGGTIGGHVFLAKPFQIETLIACIEQSLGTRAKPS